MNLLPNKGDYKLFPYFCDFPFVCSYLVVFENTLHSLFFVEAETK